MQADLREVAGYLMGEQMKEQRSRSVWVDITLLEGKLRELMEEAREYQDNTFESHQIRKKNKEKDNDPVGDPLAVHPGHDQKDQHHREEKSPQPDQGKLYGLPLCPQKR